MIPIQESLPLDEKSVKIRKESRSFKSLTLDHFTFTSKENVLGQMQKFVMDLFLQTVPISILPRGTLERMTEKVERLLGIANTEVTILGACVSLDRVKSIDPIVIRTHSFIREEYQKNAQKYYVFTEAVLGGVFLAIGRSVSVSAPKEGDEEEKWKTAMMATSFVSQGAIPKLSHEIEKVNIWSAYINWVESLREDPEGGYPIAFKVRSLFSILVENQIIKP